MTGEAPPPLQKGAGPPSFCDMQTGGAQPQGSLHSLAEEHLEVDCPSHGKHRVVRRRTFWATGSDSIESMWARV